MQQSPSASSFAAALAPVINVPREAWKRLVNHFRGVKDIGPRVAQSYAQSQDALILDVREQHEYDRWRVAGSRLIPLGTIPQRLGELEAFKGNTIVVICHGGKRSATACWILGRAGFAQTYNIAGGILAWEKAGLPIQR